MLSKPRLLIDNSAVSRGILAETLSVEAPNFGNRLLLYRAKEAPGAEAAWIRDQTECLPTIARLAREGAIFLFTYDELRNEAWRSPSAFPAQHFGALFRQVAVEEVPPAIRRDLFFQMSMSEYMDRKALLEFCDWLLQIDGDALAAKFSLLSDFEKQNLRHIQRFRDICAPIKRSLRGDAFHLWTAETNGLSGFLTMDQSFGNRAAKIALASCPPIFPSTLLADLGVRKRDRMPFKYGRRYYINGMPYD